MRKKFIIVTSLSEQREIDRIFQKGEKFVSPFFVCYFTKHPVAAEQIQYLVIASKKVGKAVQRNRAKRVLRALIRHVQNELEKKKINGIVLIARNSILEKKSTELVSYLLAFLERVGG